MKLCSRGASIENFIIFIKYLRNNPKITFPELYPSRTEGMQWQT